MIRITKTALVAAFFMFSTMTFAQRTYLGVSASGFSASTRTEFPVDAKVNGFILGFSYIYPMSKKSDMIAELSFGRAKVTAPAVAYSAGLRSNAGDKTLQMPFFNGSYYLLQSLDSKYRYKIGGGIWYGTAMGKQLQPSTSNEIFWGTSMTKSELYPLADISFLRGLQGGVLVEARARFSSIEVFTRYNYSLFSGLGTEKQKWAQDYMSLGATYLLNSEARNTESSKKKKVDF